MLAICSWNFVSRNICRNISQKGLNYWYSHHTSIIKIWVCVVSTSYGSKQIWSNLEHVSLETKLPSTFGLNGHSLSGMKKLLHTSPVEKSCVMYSKLYSFFNWKFSIIININNISIILSLRILWLGFYEKSQSPSMDLNQWLTP